MSDAHGVARDQLRSFVERVERIESEIKDLNDEKSDVYGEARSMGFDVKVLKKVVAKRKMDSAKRDEEDAIFDMYWHALHGSGLVHARTRENIEEFPASDGSPASVSTPLTTRGAEESVVLNPVAKVGEGAVGAVAAASDDPASRALEDSERQRASMVGFTDDCRTGGNEQSDASAAPVGSAYEGTPATDHELGRPAPAAVPGGEPSKPTPHDGGAKMDDTAMSPGRSDGTSAYTGAEWGEAAASNSSSSEQPHAGGKDVELHTAATQAGAIVTSAPAAKTALDYRPNFLRPEACGSSALSHCYSCTKAMQKVEEFA